MANKSDPAKKFANYVKLTVRLGVEPEARYTADGHLWAKARVCMSMGKDAEGQFKPGLWLTAKAFSRDSDAALPNALNALQKGDVVTLSGRLAYEEFTTAKGEKRSDLQLIVSKLEPFAPLADSGAAADSDFDPPAS
jgi:single-stranded DNA-binding protein